MNDPSAPSKPLPIDDCVPPGSDLGRTCAWCHQELVRHEGEPKRDFNQRLYCNHTCCNRALADRHRFRPTNRHNTSAPGGYGSIHAEGYRIIFVTEKGKRELEHRHVWEEAYGPIPEGYELHHIDGDKLNNSLENLQLLTPSEHGKLHAVLRGEREAATC